MSHATYGTFPNRVRWNEVIAPERLSYDHDDDGHGEHAFQVVVWFEDLGAAGTRLTLRQVHRDAAAVAKALRFGALEGGRQTLGKLAAYVDG